MASQKLVDMFQRDLGDKAVRPPVVTNAPILPKTGTKGTATSSTAAKTGQTTQDVLKSQLKQLPYEVRKSLYESSFKQGQGMMSTFTLPSVNDPELGQFSGLQFTEQEWQKEYGAKSMGTTISQPQGTLVDQSGKVIPRYGDENFWMEAEKSREDFARQERKGDRYQAKGLDYISEIINSRPVEDPYKNMYQPFDWSNPGTYINGIWNTVVGAKRFEDSFHRGIGSGWQDMQRNFVGAIDSQIGGGSYLNEWKRWAEVVSDDLGAERLRNPHLNMFDTVAEGGMTDPAWYAYTLGSTLPHVLGSLALSLGTAVATKNPFALASVNFAYGASMEGGSMYNQMIDDGKPIEQARQAAAIYANISGGLESVIPGLVGGKLLSKGAREMLSKMADKALKTEVAKNTAKYVGIVLGEGLTETAQELASNVTKSFYYDNIDILAGLPEAFVGGMVGGGVFAGAEALIPGQQQGSFMRPPVGNTSPLTELQKGTERPEQQVQEQAGVSTPGQTPGAQGQQTGGSLEQEIDQLLDQARAEEATIRMGEMYLQRDNDPDVARIVDETRTRLDDLNAQAKTILEQYVNQNAEMIVNSPEVVVQVGRTPDGRFVGTGIITIGESSFTISPDVLSASQSRSEAILNATMQLQSWFVDTLQRDGIQNEQATNVVYDNLNRLIDLYGDAETFVEQNGDAVLAAQDSATAADFRETMTQENININEGYNIDAFFQRANDVDAVRITAKEAEQIVQDLASDLGVGVKFVEKVSTNPRALGRFVQDVSTPQGWIEIRTQGDGAQDIRISTPLHEVGHAYFRNLLTKDQQKDVLDVVRDKYKDPEMSDAMAEERLVEDMKHEAAKQSKRRSKYGRFLTKLMDIAERLVKWLGRDPNAKIDEFYRNVLSKKRPSERKKMMERVREERKNELRELQEEAFQDPGAVTSKFFKHKELSGREYVGYIQATNALKGAGLKQAEVDLIQAVLDTQFKDEKRIPVQTFKDAIIAELVPLDVVASDKYAGYGLDRIGMEGMPSVTHIYDGPVEHGISGHFTGETTKLFGHTRIAWDGKTRYLLEVQSDFFQKGRSGHIALPTTKDVESAIAMLNKYREMTFGSAKDALHEQFRMGKNNSAAEYLLYSTFKKTYYASGSTGQWVKDIEAELLAQIPRSEQVEKLSVYSNIWHERMLKEEIRLAAQDNMKVLRIPTPKTLAFIEGYKGTTKEVPYDYNDEDGDILQVGDVISMGGYDYYVFESDQSSIVVVGKVSGTIVPRTEDSYKMDIGGNVYYFPRERSETLSQPRAYKSGAGFKVEALPDVQRKVYDFYKNKVNPYFQKLRKDNVREVTDENGNTWLETDILPSDMEAVEAFQTEDVIYRGGNIQSLQNLNLTTSADLVRDGVLDIGAVFAEGPGYYFTSDPEDASIYGDTVLKAKSIDGARILTKTDRLTRKEVNSILKSVDKDVLELAASNWSENIQEGKNALVDMIMGDQSAHDQLMSIWADIYYHDSPEAFIDVVAKNGIDGVRIDKPGGVQHTVIYNKNILQEVIEAFQEEQSYDLADTLIARGVKQSQLAITPSSVKNPRGFVAMALSADVPNQVKPVLLQAFGKEKEAFLQYLKKSKLVDVREGVQYAEENGMPLDGLWEQAQQIKMQPAPSFVYEPTVVMPEHVQAIRSVVTRLERDPDTSGFDMEVLQEISQEIVNMSGADFAFIVKQITDSEVSTYIKEELLAVVKQYQQRPRAMLEQGQRGQIEMFQEIPTPEDADVGSKKIFDITPVESLPSVEQQRYIEVFKRLSEARRTMMQATQDSLVDALTDVTEKIETLWKYDQYLVLQYGLGVRSQEMQIVDDVTAEVQEQMVRWQLLNDENMYMTPRIPTAVKLQTARNLAKAWKDIVVASKYVGAKPLSNEMAQYDFASVIERIGRLKEFASTQLTDKQLASMDVFLQAQSDLDQYIITQEGDTNTEGDATDVELAEVWQMASDAVDSKTGRARMRDIGRQEDMDLARMEKSITRLGKQQEKAQALRARFQRLRTKKIERAEYLAQTDADRKVKQRIHAQLMKEKRTVTMTEEQMMRFKYRQQSIGAEQAAKEAKEEMRRQYKLAKQRALITQKIVKLEKALRDRIKKGTSIDVAYGKQILEVLEIFQKSAVSNQLRDAYLKLLEMKKQGMFDRMVDAEGNPITQEERDMAIEAIERIERRLKQQALSQMTVEQMEELYSGIAQLVEEGRIMLQLKAYLNEQELEKQIETVVNGTVNLDGKIEMGTTAASLTKGAKKVDRKRMYLSVLAPSAVADRADGDKQYSGQNAKIQREISAAGAAYVKEESSILVEAFTRIKEEVGINEFTEMESAFITFAVREREGKPGQFARDQIVKHVFNGVIPGAQVGRVTRTQAEQIIDILQDTMAKYALSERFIGTYEAITNKIFPKMENYVMMSKYVNAPNAWETASEDGVDILQGHMVNSKNANIGSSNARQAANEMLIPRTDFLRLYADTISQQAYYVHMQPVLNNASKIVNSRAYQEKAGQALSKWWQEYLSIVAKRGQWSGAANNRWLDKVKNNVTVAILAFKPSTMIMQLTQVSTGVMGTFAKYGPKAAFNVMQETVRMVAQRQYRNQVIQDSNALSARAGTAGQYGVADVQQAITLQEFAEKNMVTIARDAATKYGMYLMQDLDITFASANAEGIRKALLDAGLSEADARTEADAMMGVMQSSTLVSDRPLFIAQGGSITKFLTALQTFSLGYYSMFTQLLVRGGVVKGDVRTKARALAAIAMIPVANALIGSLAREASALLRGDDQEDEFNLLNAVFFEQMRVVPIIGPMAQAALEYNKKGGLDNPAFGAMTKVLTGTMKALTESDDKQLDGIIDALSGVSMFAGVPGTATLGDVAKSFTYSEQQQIDRTLKQQVAGRDWKSLTQRDIDRIVSEVSMKKYGTLDITSAQKTAMEKTVYKAAMKQDSNDLVKMFATKSKNADKALILLEMSEQMSSTEFQSIVTKLRSTKMLSEEGYMEFMKIKRGR